VACSIAIRVLVAVSVPKFDRGAAGLPELPVLLTSIQTNYTIRFSFASTGVLTDYTLTYMI